ncbi:MAG: hypothetical protein IKP77_00915 [Acholeplasmatales bacterium]|nr:hypothetical protein [Acholeplasmatales bacterium]
MKYRIDNIKISPSNDDIELYLKNKYKIDDFNYKILLKSIDARDKNNVFYLYNVMLECNEKILGKNVSEYVEKSVELDYPKYSFSDRPVVVGFGPSGMFSGLYLARCGAKPIIIERGSRVEERKKKVEDFLKNKVLCDNSNVQFGEGGAGTFSDGKLTTNVKDKLIGFILYEFYKHGARENILYESHPHIGTDYLEIIVKSIREEIISLGGEFYFDTLFMDYSRDKVLCKKLIDDSIIEFKSNHVLLGIGHSAKDTIRHLYDNMHINIEPKAFSMGVRIEHKREDINKAQYGKFSKYLPSAYYKLACHNDRGIYTFCMCPGGFVLASTSDNNSIVTNGMSNNDRMGDNSNSALLVDVRVDDYYKSSPLDGIDYQEKYEKLAYSISKDYKAPANLVKEFLEDKIAKEERSIKTSYPHGLTFCDLSKVLPNYVISGLKFGIVEFDKKLKGFNNPDAIIIGVESRSSSPVRILRGENRCSSIEGIYPIGEGAGYAGGITSSALDGLKTAIEIVNKSNE